MSRILLCLAAAVVGCQESRPVAQPTAPEAESSAVGSTQAVAPPVGLTAAGAAAFAELAQATRFTDDAVGGGGVTPEEVVAWRTLIEEPNAAEAFAALQQQATVPGQLFGLCGMYYTDAPAFEAAIAPYRADTREIATMMGCTIADQPVADLVQRRRGKRIVLDHREQSVTEWLRAHDGQSGMLDIAGGGYPAVFRHP